MSLHVVALSAGLWSPSKTTTLARTMLNTVATELSSDATLVELGPIAARLGGTFARTGAPAEVTAALATVETADLVIAATPVFRGSYTGHFKHFFDLIEPLAFLGKPVILAASGGGSRHCLVVEHQMRPLFAFFQSLTFPTAVYASDIDFHDYELRSEAVLSRIRQVALEATRLLTPVHKQERQEPWGMPTESRTFDTFSRPLSRIPPGAVPSSIGKTS